MVAFQQAMRDVNATIGSAFIGVVNVFASVAREVGGVLLPLMRQLTPIMNALGNALGTTLVAVVRVVVAAFQTVVPVLDVLAAGANEFAKILSDVLGLVTAVVKTFGAALLGVLGANPDGFKDAFKGIADAIRTAIKAVVSFAANLAVFFGFGDSVKKLGDAVGKEADERDKRAAGLKAAATGAQITDIAALVKQAQIASFTAAGGGAAREKPEVQFLRDISQSLLAANQEKTFEKALGSWWLAIKSTSPLREALAGMANIIGALETVFRVVIARRF